MRTVLALLACAAAATACQTEGGGAKMGAAATPACSIGSPPTSDPAQASNRDAFLQYARGLAFEDAAAPTGERRKLTVPLPTHPPTFGLGPTASIQPQHCDHENNRDDLTAGHGRIIAMFTLDQPYNKLSLPADTSYLWVDDLNAKGDSARGVIIPVDRKVAPTVVPIRVDFHGSFPHAFSEARWGFDPSDDYAWSSCAKTGCCYLEGGQPGPRDTLP